VISRKAIMSLMLLVSSIFELKRYFGGTWEPGIFKKFDRIYQTNAVKSLCDIWHPQDIPNELITSSRATVTGIPCSEPLGPFISKPTIILKNTQLLFAVSPSTQPSPISPPYMPTHASQQSNPLHHWIANQPHADQWLKWRSSISRATPVSKKSVLSTGCVLCPRRYPMYADARLDDNGYECSRSLPSWVPNQSRSTRYFSCLDIARRKWGGLSFRGSYIIWRGTRIWTSVASKFIFAQLSTWYAFFQQKNHGSTDVYKLYLWLARPRRIRK
jgi:hypothetical protein